MIFAKHNRYFIVYIIFPREYIMKASERAEKFTRFKELHLSGQLRTPEIISQLGISKNTLYNWRKRVNDGSKETKQSAAMANTSSFPSFTKIIPQPKPAPSISHHIEISIGNSIVIRIPETLQSHSLQQIFRTLAHWNTCR